MIRKLIEKIRKPRRNFKANNLIIGLVIGLLVLALLSIGTISWGVYKLRWQGKFINQVLSILPLPAADVNGTFILYPDYLKALKAAEKFYAKQKVQGLPNIPSSEKMQQIVMEDRLIENVLVKEIAQNYNVSVVSAEINAKMDEIIASKGSASEVEKFLQDYYDLDIAEYKKYFIEPNLYYDKTNEAIEEDDLINGEAKKKIQEALNKLRNGEDFAKVAAEYTEDQDALGNKLTKENFLRGELPKDIEDQLFGMKAGDYTDILTLPGALVIFKLDNKDEAKGVLSINKIVIKIKTITDLLKEQKNKAQIKIYAY